MRTSIVLLVIGIGCRSALVAAAPPRPDPPPAHCEIAVVSPVSGNAECVKPPGARVDPPPARPPPTEQQCLDHPDLAVEECKQTPPDLRDDGSQKHGR